MEGLLNVNYIKLVDYIVDVYYLFVDFQSTHSIN